MKKPVYSLALSACLALSLAAPAPAYERYEKATVEGGTVVTVYAGSVGENSETYLEDDSYDYVSYVRFVTPGRLTSTSNITVDTVFEEKTPGTPEGYGRVCNGGVEGVSWDNETNTLTLDGAWGTVLTIEGPSLDVRNLNTPNDKLDTNVDIDMESLGYFFQRDLFEMGSGEVSPHEKENETLQDTVTLCLQGESHFHHIRLSGNVKVILTGSGSLTLDATGDLGSYFGPERDSSYAFASAETIGQEGSLENAQGELLESVMELPFMKRTISEAYRFLLPEIELGEGLTLSEGEVHNASLLDADFFCFTGELPVTDESRRVENGAALEQAGLVYVDGSCRPVTYNAEKTTFYVSEVRGMGPDEEEVFFDISADVVAYQPYSSYVGEGAVPAAQLVISGKE